MEDIIDRIQITIPAEGTLFSFLEKHDDNFHCSSKQNVCFKLKNLLHWFATNAKATMNEMSIFIQKESKLTDFKMNFDVQAWCH